MAEAVHEFLEQPVAARGQFPADGFLDGVAAVARGGLGSLAQGRAQGLSHLVRGQGRAPAEDKGFLEHVAQLPDIARPVVGGKRRHGFRADPGVGLAHFPGMARQEVAHQKRDVAGPLAQGGQGQGHHLQAIVEVLAELPLAHGGFQVAVGGRDDAHVHGNDLPPAQTLDVFFLQQPQQLGLDGHGHVADLVEKDRAVVGLFDLAHLAAGRAGEGSFFVAEQLGFEQRLGDGHAVDDQKGFIGP